MLKTISKKLNRYKEAHAAEKVYLHTDRDYYTNGDTLWFKVAIVDGIFHAPSDKSRVVYVELLDSDMKVVERRRMYTGFEGGTGDIALAGNFTEGNYFLRAYTNYMLNEREPVFFQKKIPIWTYTPNSKKKIEKISKKKRTKGSLQDEDEVNAIATERPIVQFFPEGGNLVSGLTNNLGLKVTDGKGRGISLTGKILDQNGALMAMFVTYEFGLGQVQFKVETGTDYFAEIEMDGKLEKFPIPKALPKGYILQLSNRGEYLRIKATTNIEDGLKGSLLLGHLRGDKVLEHLIADKTEHTFEVKLSTAELDDGVAAFTLFTPNGEPVCERLVFVENPNNEVKLAVETDSSKYGFRSKVNIDVAILDQQGIPLQGDFSMSVVPQNALNKEAESIKSWLLLNSDLGGTVENPNYFFDEGVGSERKNLLDMLMLTHGWRRFIWRELGSDESDVKLRYPPEKGIVINGSTVSLKNRTKALKNTVRLTISEPSAYEEETSTSAEGKFSFGPMIFRDSIKAVINAIRGPNAKKEVAIYLEPSFPSVSFEDSIRFKNQSQTIEVTQSFQEEAKRKKVSDFEYDPKVIQLDEAIGRGELKTKKELINEALNERTMYGQAINRIIPDSILDSQSMSVIDLIERKMAVYRINGFYPNQSIELRPYSGSNTVVPGREGIDQRKDPLYLLDGIPVAPDLINQMFGAEILFIDVLKTAGEVAQYGMRGANGVIAVYTPRGENFEFVQEKELDVASFTIPGFYRSREFYSPNYTLKKPIKAKPDYRTTLHWQPNIKLMDVAPANISFYTGDASGTYAIRIEGMTIDRRPFSGLYSFTVR